MPGGVLGRRYRRPALLAAIVDKPEVGRSPTASRSAETVDLRWLEPTHSAVPGGLVCPPWGTIDGIGKGGVALGRPAQLVVFFLGCRSVHRVACTCL